MNKHNADIIDIGAIILEKLKEKERSVAWLARKIGKDKDNLNKTLKNSNFIYYDLVFQISKALDENFFDYGTQKLNETK